MTKVIASSCVTGALVILTCSVGLAFAVTCPSDMVSVGPICVDKYEASVWSKPPKGTTPQGMQYGVPGNGYPCSANGNDCAETGAKIYAASVPGVTPSASITWFQAQQACANVGKRLLRNGEWQMAAAGTPDPGDSPATAECNTNSGDVATGASATGSRSLCVSNWGALDMVGNVWEWVEDWIQTNGGINATDTTTALYGGDLVFGIDEAFPQVDAFPAAILRGGNWGFAGNGGLNAGVFALHAGISPSYANVDIGFRCAR